MAGNIGGEGVGVDGTIVSQDYSNNWEVDKMEAFFRQFQS